MRQRVTRTFKHREFVVYDLQPREVALGVVKIEWLKDVFNAHMFGIIEQLEVGFLKQVLDWVDISWVRDSVEVWNIWGVSEKWIRRFFKLQCSYWLDNCYIPIWSLFKSYFSYNSVWAWAPRRELAFDYIKWIIRSILIFDFRYFIIVEDLKLWFQSINICIIFS